MYYYEGKELGTIMEAKEKIMADKDMACSLIDAYLFNAFNERYLREMVVDTTVFGRGLTMEWLVEDALQHLENMWLDEGGWSQLKGDRASLGDFEYENWEEEE